jgi:hypothetical protein
MENLWFNPRSGAKAARRGSRPSLRVLAGRLGVVGGILALALNLPAAERVFDFTQMPVNEPPPGFGSALVGEGTPGDWRIVFDEVPSAMATLTPNAVNPNRRGVLAQLGTDRTDERFPILVFEEEKFGDFTFTTKFKIVSGEAERMAGIVFRYQDERNFYVLRASSLGRTFYFYKVVNGIRGAPIGERLDIPPGVWHELSVRCKGNSIDCFLNGQQVIPTLTDNSFTQGKVGFWTKSDSVSYFVDAHLDYVPLEMLATVLVRQAAQKYSRVRSLRLYATTTERPELHVVASTDASVIGRPGTDIERRVIAENRFAYGKEAKRKIVVVTLPLHDRNGDPIAAVRVEMESFPGQTEQNALVRALPIVKSMEIHVRSNQDLTR